MAMTIRGSLLVLLSALGAACAGDPGTMGTSDVLEAATLENTRHADVCRRAGSLGAMLDDVTRHESAMDELMAQMATGSDPMRTDMGEHHCSETGMDRMSHDLADTNTEMAMHSKQMRAAPNLGAGHFECSVHAHELGKLLGSMRKDSGSMSCASR